jgi:hypothetical protein
MLCNNTFTDDRCGKCRYNVLSNDFVRNKSLVKVAKVAAKIAWMNEFNDDNGILNAFGPVYMSCNEVVSITKANKNENFSIIVIKAICNKLFNNWYTYYPLSKRLGSYEYITEKLSRLNDTSFITKVRTILMSIVKYTEEVTTCNGTCTTVIPGKEVGTCKFPLSDINKIVKFTSDGIVDLFNTILYSIKDVAAVNLTIDLNTTYVTCTGNIIMDTNFVVCKSTLNDMKSTYIYYLSAWCSANICKQSEVSRIRDNIANVKKANHISQIYQLSNDLLEII